MLKTLRARFILSHTLLLLLIVPLVGVVLIFLLETRVLLTNLSNELAGQALLAADAASYDPLLWRDSARAQAFALAAGSRLQVNVMLLNAQGTILASSDPLDQARIGQSAELTGLDQALAGEMSVRTVYSQSARQEIVDVLVPVFGSSGRVLGIVRLSHQVHMVYGRFVRLRTLVALVVGGGILLGIAVGWALAYNLERPLRRVTHTVQQLTSGETLVPLPEQGSREIRELTQSVNLLVERLRTLEESRRQLLANLVHELGRPLGALRSAVQALRGGADQDPALRQELLLGMEGEIARLGRLLDDLARFREQALGALELNRRPTPLSDWLSQTLAPWREAAQAKGLHWQADLPADLPSVMIDPDRLGQALGNLLSNAVKYTLAGGRVWVEAGVQGGEVWVRVNDTGPGIPPGEQSSVFAPLYRRTAQARFPQGMGLGLGIARDLATAHGGRIELESAPGLGSHFTLWLPLHPPDTPASPA